MPDDRTPSSCYESKYGGKWITAPKRLAEFACERIAGEDTLGNQFWSRSPWDKTFVREITHANKLLKDFSIEAITKAWGSWEGRRVRTLGAPFFRTMVELEQRKLDLKASVLEKETKPADIDVNEKPRAPIRINKSIREKLL